MKELKVLIGQAIVREFKNNKNTTEKVKKFSYVYNQNVTTDC